MQINHTNQISVCLSCLLSWWFVGGSIFLQSTSLSELPVFPLSPTKFDWWSDSWLIRLILQSTWAHKTRMICFVRRTEKGFKQIQMAFYIRTVTTWGPRMAQFQIPRHRQIQPWRHANGKPGLRRGHAHRQFTLSQWWNKSISQPLNWWTARLVQSGELSRSRVCVTDTLAHWGGVRGCIFLLYHILPPHGK